MSARWKIRNYGNVDDPKVAYTTENLFEIRILRRTETLSTSDDGDGTGSSTAVHYSYTVQWESDASLESDDERQQKQ